MKLAFDEHVPSAMATVFKTLAAHRGIRSLCPDLEIEAAKDYAPAPDDHDYIKRNDAPWVKRYAKAGGQVIISGDQKMRSKPGEREALVQAGMVVFFFDPAWNHMRFCDKCAMLLHWWEAILETAKGAPRPSFWRIPATWKSDAGIMVAPHHDLKLERIERQKAAQTAVAAERKARRSRPADPAQIKIQFSEPRSPNEPTEK